MENNSHIRNLIEQLRQRELTEAEWRELSLEVDGDPFLEDAIEGLKQLPADQRIQHVANIQRRLSQQSDQKRSGGFYRWGAAAAAVMLLVTAVILRDQLSPPIEEMYADQEVVRQRDDIATNDYQDDQNAANSDIAQIDDQDQIPVDHSTGEVAKRSKGSPTVQVSPTQSVPGTGDSEAKKRLENTSTVELSAPNYSPTNAPHPADEPSIAAEEIRVKGSREDAAAYYIDGVRIAGDTRQEETTPTNDISALAATETGIDSSSDVMLPEGIALDEAIVTGYQKPGNKRKKNRPPTNVAYALASPSDGWQDYYKYIRKEIKIPKAAQEAGIEGTVGLEFDLDQDGTPTEFRVVESLGYGCDTEAIRLVREGPKWDVKNAQVPIGRIEIDF